jgi:photosystem II stability/assembly factor-like uncharacterized protein
MKFLPLLLLLAATLLAQSEWEAAHQALFGKPGSGAYFLTSQTGWLGGVEGVIYHTSTGGAEWGVQREPVSGAPTINDIYFLDAQNGWACGDFGTILITSDGGATWSPAQITSTQDDLESITFVSTSNGYACGSNGTILKTTNGGQNWVRQNSGTTKDLSGIAFFDANNGFVIINENVSTVLWTNSAGFLWSVSNFNRPPGQLSSRMDGCYAVRGSSTGWIIGYHGNIFKTTTRGQSWTHMVSLYGTDYDYAEAIAFVDQNTGFAGGRLGQIYRTYDGGVVWDTVRIGTAEDISRIRVIDADTIVAFADNQQIRLTSDGGESWTTMVDSPRPDFRSVCLVDSLHVLASTFAGDLMQTADGGVSFSVPGNTGLPTTGAIETIKFRDNLNGFYGSHNGQFGVTNDGGASWARVMASGVNSLERIQAISIVNATVAYACAGLGGDGRVYKTEDSGASWTEVYAVDETLNDIFMFDANLGFTIGKGTIYKCTNGSDWAMVDSLGEFTINAITFRDNQHGFIVGYNGLLIETQDGGNSWAITDTIDLVADSLILTPELWDVEFVSESEGWIAAGNATGTQGAFHHTLDGGVNWTHINSPGEITPREMDYLSPDYIWAAGWFGSVFVYRPQANGIPEWKLLPSDSRLMQNYPNPFNPVTVIQYYLNKAGQTELAVYNMLGQQVRLLNRSRQNAGMYYYHWNGENDAGEMVSSGMYIYQLKIDQETHAKRMIFIR